MPPIASTARWPSAPSPGSSRRGTDGFAIAASSATRPGSTDASRPSTYAGSSASREARAPGCSPAPNRSSGASQGGNDTCGRKTYQRGRFTPSTPALRCGLAPEDPRPTLRRYWVAGKALFNRALDVPRGQFCRSPSSSCFRRGLTHRLTTTPEEPKGYRRVDQDQRTEPSGAAPPGDARGRSGRRSVRHRPSAAPTRVIHELGCPLGWADRPRLRAA